MTRIQQLEKQKKDLTIRCSNYKAEIRHIMELSEESNNELLKAIDQKDDVILMLQKEIGISDETNNALRSENSGLKDRIKELENLLEMYKAKEATDSSNSSKPSGTDGFKEVIQNNREPSNRKPGGQPGHKGHKLELTDAMRRAIESGDVEVEIVEHGIPGLKEPVIKYELDIELKVILKKHVFHEGEPVPKGLNNPYNYGPLIKGSCVYLLSEGMMSKERLCDYISSATNGMLDPSEATVASFANEFASGEQFEKMYGQLKEDVINALVLHTDDTQLKCTERPVSSEGKNVKKAVTVIAASKGKKEKEDLPADNVVMETKKGSHFNLGVRTYSTEDTTLLTLNPTKGIAGVENDGILPKFVNTLVHDHDKKFYRYGGRHSECNAHPARKLKGLCDMTGHTWCSEMRSLLYEMNNHKKSDLSAGKTAMDVNALEKYKALYDETLTKGGTEAKSNANKYLYTKELNLLKQLREYKKNHLLFAEDYTVPFTNNLAERSFRFIKTRQKVCGCHRSYESAEKMIKISSIIRTAKKRGLAVFDVIQDILNDKPVFTTPG